MNKHEYPRPASTRFISMVFGLTQPNRFSSNRQQTQIRQNFTASKILQLYFYQIYLYLWHSNAKPTNSIHLVFWGIPVFSCKYSLCLLFNIGDLVLIQYLMGVETSTLVNWLSKASIKREGYREGPLRGGRVVLTWGVVRRGKCEFNASDWRVVTTLNNISKS